MIPVSISTLESNNDYPADSNQLDWQKQMSRSFRTAMQLLNYLGINESNLPYKIDHDSEFKTRISVHLANQIDANNPYDPILLQILPQEAEREIVEGFVMDPLAEGEYSPVKGLIHKYQNRVLLIAHQSCAIHCRYCFRRHYPYQNQRLDQTALDQCFDYISQRSEINEVILSGGDPLSLSDQNLTSLLFRLDDLDQLTTIRIHTRTPIVLPDRLSDELLECLGKLKKQIVMVLHINHPNEITSALSSKLLTLRNHGVLLLNQSVLLKDINDSADILVNLCENLFSIGVLPYYLHSLDPVRGTHHFHVPEMVQIEIWREMQARLSGYLLPRLVKEIPYKQSKTWINPCEKTKSRPK